MSPRDWWSGTLWALCLVQLLTIDPTSRGVLLQPLSAEWAATLCAYLVTSAGLLPGRRFPAGPHLLVVALMMLAHPLTTLFGRDGSLIAMSLHFLTVLHRRTRLAPEGRLLVTSLVVALLASEAILSSLRQPTLAAPKGVPDYGDVMGPYAEGGFLKPGLDVRVVGERGLARFITERHGFRNRRDVEPHKPPGTWRGIFVGDSFVAGYRTDQDETVGQVLENELRQRTGRAAPQILVAGAGYPGAAATLVTRHLLSFEPDLVLIGVTVGNDISQSWLGSGNRPSELLASLLLPADAFEPGYLGLLPARLERSLRAWRTYRRIADALAPNCIAPWYEEWPGQVHLFDPGHSLGHFFARRKLPLVEASFEALFLDMATIEKACRARHVPVLFALFPQRFQTSAGEWQATLRRWGLAPSAFDASLPNRRILAGCAERGLDCLDLLPAFRSECGAGPCYLGLGDMHWNARGHAVAAHALAARISVRSPPPGPAATSGASQLMAASPPARR